MPSFGLDFKYDEAAFIDSTRLPVQAQEVLKQCAAACKKFLIGQEEMQAVPLWSRPVWRALGVNVLNRSSLTALLAMEELKKNPKLLLTDEAYGILRDLAFRQDPDTFGEASSARGGLLRSDFAKLLSRGRSLVDLVSVLDALASHPRDLSLAPEDLAKAAEAAEDVDEDLRTAEVRLPSRLDAGHCTTDCRLSRT
jgi:hypothetical protein